VVIAVVITLEEMCFVVRVDHKKNEKS